MKYLVLGKIFVFAVLIYLGQLCIIHFFPIVPPPSVLLVNKYHSADVDTIFFGDSTLFYTSVNDTDTRDIPTMLNDLFDGTHSVGSMMNAAWNPDVYLGYSKHMQSEKYIPKNVIISINLHSFSIPYDLRPSYQFTDDTMYFRYYNTPLFPYLNILRNLASADVNQKYSLLYEYSDVYDEDNFVGISHAFETIPDTVPYPERFKNMIIFYYMASLRSDHRKLISLKNIAKMYANNSSKVIFYITPIDYQSAEKFLGNRFTERIKKNTAIISSALQHEGGIVLDLSLSLSHEYFTWSEIAGSNRYMDEHLNSNGKFYIGQRLAKLIDPTSSSMNRIDFFR